jgi:ribosomal protein L31
VSSRRVRAIQRNPVSKTKKQTNKQTNKQNKKSDNSQVDVENQQHPYFSGRSENHATLPSGIKMCY